MEEPINDLVAPLRSTAKRMFRGFGIMLNGAMFALRTRDELYFRVDDTTRSRFEAAGCSPFGCNRVDRDVVIASYYAVPPDLWRCAPCTNIVSGTEMLQQYFT
jgi:DNA transformation protein and related proteins